MANLTTKIAPYKQVKKSGAPGSILVSTDSATTQDTWDELPAGNERDQLQIAGGVPVWRMGGASFAGNYPTLAELRAKYPDGQANDPDITAGSTAIVTYRGGTAVTYTWDEVNLKWVASEGGGATTDITWPMVIDKPFSLISQRDFSVPSNELQLRTGSGSMIPSQATTANQLADKEFVNSSILNMASRFIVDSASDGGAFDSHATLIAGPYYYQGAATTPTNNDYAIVTRDENHGNLTSRYMYDGAVWSWQYSMNNTEFTAGQMETLNSTVTLQDKQKWDMLQDSKQDKLTAGNNIDISGSVISSTYALPTASSTVLGGVKVGDGLVIDNGTLSVESGDDNGSGYIIAEAVANGSDGFTVTDDRIPNPIPHGYVMGIRFPTQNGGSRVTLSVNGSAFSPVNRGTTTTRQANSLVSLGSFELDIAQHYVMKFDTFRVGRDPEWAIIDRPVISSGAADIQGQISVCIQWWHR